MIKVKLVSVEGIPLETDYQHALKIFEIQNNSNSKCWELSKEDKNYEFNESGILTRRDTGKNKAAKESSDS
ncbi:hypothetical protein DR864_00370 [Runella rosea]|uniref:Uncharacterized protein n=1 Tax=Runella rosea TaxID=2259595 RepID=A0A344TC61_9BACT|nr:hypothetical protein [Runella rosea]AXE16232.1 hypothetical protein DR864_00095 [Runella rosea]AXE16287.1 hypothetical protein DR864_00370 [Runella rosea]